MTTTGCGPSPSGVNKNTGTISPSKLSKRCSSGSTSPGGGSETEVALRSSPPSYTYTSNGCVGDEKPNASFDPSRENTIDSTAPRPGSGTSAPSSVSREY